MAIYSSNDKLEGHLDRIDGVRVLGWAWQSDLADGPASVDLYVDDIYISSVTASSYRPDLEKAGKGNGRHAFEISIPEQYCDGETHSVGVCYGDTTVHLYGSPQKVRINQKATPHQIGAASAKQIQKKEWLEGAAKLHAVESGGNWVSAVPNPTNPELLSHVRMFAVLGTWMEADVVAATIRNAVTQGCERIYLIDNDSPDNTVDVACNEGAILARSYHTEYHDEVLRLRHMNDVVAEVSESEGDKHIWWLFLDADEFPHGPRGMTLRDYLKTLDRVFRVVGTRYINHYPSAQPYYIGGRHPLDFQPLCEELVYPMCRSGHRKHPLLRFDRGGARIECGRGLHQAYCTEHVYEPTEAAFIHHFPFREEDITRKRLGALWAKDQNGEVRARNADDAAHMLARHRSLDAVYTQEWSKVENFITSPPSSGVTLGSWNEVVEPEHQHVLRWYSMIGAWNYDTLAEFNYGDDTTYKKGISFLDGHGTIEDWGCGFTHAKTFVTKSEYVGVDGSAKCADKIVDLREYTCDVDCIFMRHVLEHNFEWRRVLRNAIASFKKRMVLIVFTPLAKNTRQIATSSDLTAIPVPDISFKREDLTDYFQSLIYREESLETDTQYGTEHVFYLEKPGAGLGISNHAFAAQSRENASKEESWQQACCLVSKLQRTFNEDNGLARRLDAKNGLEMLAPAMGDTQTEEQLLGELNAWAATGIVAKFWWRDDDAVRDTPQLRRLLDIAEDVGVMPAVAVIPGQADDGLAKLISTAKCCIWQHGWKHDFHLNGEFGDGRAVDLMADDAIAGQGCLDRLFGPAGWQRVFVPPNHGLSMAFKALIPSLGYLGVSTGTPITPGIENVVEINAAIDMMNWPEGNLLDAAAIDEMIVGELKSRRTGTVPVDSPIGILTHHLMFDENAWSFVSELFRRLKSHPAVELLRADDLFIDKNRVISTGLSSTKLQESPTANITVVITSCGRQDLLSRTLDSFLKYNTYPIRELIVIEDGEADKNLDLQKRYHQHNIKWLSTGARVGQIAAIDIAYHAVQTEYIFHCEDDWEFFNPGFIEKSLPILKHNPDVLQVWIRALNDTNNCPVMNYLLYAKEVPYRLIQPGYHTEEWGTWHGFSFNPGLRRRIDYLLLGSFGALDPTRNKKSYEVEREASAFYLAHGFLAAILADNGGHGYVRHIGWGRRVEMETDAYPASNALANS